MKRFLVTLLSLMMLLSTAVYAETAAPQTDWSGVEWKNEDFRITSHLSPSHKLYTNFYEPLYKYIEEATGGKVTFTVFWAGELVDLGQESDALLDGLVDMAWPISPIYEGDKMKLTEVVTLPLTQSNSAVASEAWKLLLESEVPLVNGKTFREYTFDDLGIKVLGPTISEAYTIGTVNKDFNTIDSIKSMKLRTGSRSQQLFTTTLGASAITMPAADLFDSLSRGALDGAFLWVPDWPNYGLQNLFSKALEGLNCGHFPSVFAMSQTRWDSLQPELQQLLVEGANKFRLSGGQGVVDSYAEVKEEAIAMGVEFVQLGELPQDVQEYFQDAMVKTWEDYIALLESEGLPGKELCLLWRDLVVQAGGEVPEAVMGM
jgi:TRAP-type C4-dicarboxylate transport system substrate-binding protein